MNQQIFEQLLTKQTWNSCHNESYSPSCNQVTRNPLLIHQSTPERSQHSVEAEEGYECELVQGGGEEK